MHRDWQLALTLLARDWRAGELRLLAAALIVAVASLTSVSFFTDRVRMALEFEAHQLLGADLLLIADHPWKGDIPDELGRRIKGGAKNAAADDKLHAVTTLSFVSMARVKDASQLVGIKVVEDGYPLRGALRIRDIGNSVDRETRLVPAPGTVWIEERLLAGLNIKPGDMLEIGASRLTVAAVLTFESDRGIGFFNIAPRMMMNAADLAATQLMQDGSRVTYSLLVAGGIPAVDAFRTYATAHLARGERLEALDNARPEIRNVLDRARNFLGLTSLLAVILAAVAIGLAARHFTERHLDGFAVMRCIGASQAQLTRLFTIEFLAIGMLASGIGIAIGYAAQMVLTGWLADMVDAPLPQPSLWPVASGFITGVLLLAGFALPPLLQLKRVPAMRVLRREMGESNGVSRAAYVVALVAVAGLLVWQAGSIKLGIYAFGGFAGLFLLFGFAGRMAIQLFGLVRRYGEVSWRYGLASLRRRASSTLTQIVALAVGMTAILLLTITANDLLASWSRAVPPDAPNRFVLNIQPEQRDAIAAFFRDQQLASPVLYPMIRGRLTAINGKPVRAADYAEDRAQRLVEREFNLSWAADLPNGNHIVEGVWFKLREKGAPQDAHQLSVEQGLMKTLGLKFGDVLTWNVAGQDFSAAISNVRKLDWDSMRVNFFVMAPPGLIDDFPASYITSFHLDDNDQPKINRLVQTFPNLTVVDVGMVMQQMQRVLNQVSRAVQFVFLFAIAAGLLVLFAAIQATQDERLREAAIMRTLGASRSQLMRAQLAEFAVTGALAGLFAAAGASAVGWVVATRVLELAFTPNPWIFLLGAVSGAAGVVLAAWPGMHASVSTPPIQVLRAVG